MSDTTQTVPTHVGFILDGNRRWAKENGLPTLEGHRNGYDRLKDIAEHAYNKGVRFVSAYVFSTENWNRTKDEVDYLMQLALRMALNDAQELIKKNIKIMILGIEDRVPQKVMSALKKVQEDSKNNDGGTLALCFNYGGQQEITDAVKAIVSEGIDAEDVTAETISKHLYAPEIPPVDLMIRTSGEQRISNFMLWRLAYAELCFVHVHWPEFSTEDFDKALLEYQTRNRRFGGN